MTENWQEHYKDRKNRPPAPFLITALPFVQHKGTAVDVGSGDLVDARFLLSQGFNKVIAIDKEFPPKESLNVLPKSNFEFIRSSFDQFEFPVKEYDLVNAHYSLPFNSPKTFEKVWGGIERSLTTNGIFVGQFLGNNDQWNDKTRDMTFHTAPDVQNLLSAMEILELQEEERDWVIASGHNKHWHVFHVIAKVK
jgi:hypothetical protein